MQHHETPIRVDHIGIAVESVDNVEPFLSALGCEKLLDDTIESRFRWVYYELGDGSRLELIEPVAEESFLTDFLDEHGPGLHHVTLETADIDAVIGTLEAADVDVIDYREFEEWTEAFVSPRNPTGALFQLMEYQEAYEQNREIQAQELFIDGRRLTNSQDLGDS
ncbi:hypothetical protein C474_14704 [Halogeometricum pallidum JCM 14848]|uniref:VOC domain-containing protein n=1 Tax=Halogeometricum pallidum JCM 14848 TaxID=1227487 RepID=M0D1K6_HALPD|nr:VOC family protein [Halogeometricum pallidum]ELZ28753.1 hypothetical protein C474_14704 [Halogeometricum pallidum JCM 14848]